MWKTLFPGTYHPKATHITQDPGKGYISYNRINLPVRQVEYWKTLN